MYLPFAVKPAQSVLKGRVDLGNVPKSPSAKGARLALERNLGAVIVDYATRPGSMLMQTALDASFAIKENSQQKIATAVIVVMAPHIRRTESAVSGAQVQT
eukprot:COSAG01_NODE_5621_length_4142_cov_1.812021_1_plen_101_part_00